MQGWVRSLRAALASLVASQYLKRTVTVFRESFLGFVQYTVDLAEQMKWIGQKVTSPLPQRQTTLGRGIETPFVKTRRFLPKYKT